jgi:hypothetical protein
MDDPLELAPRFFYWFSLSVMAALVGVAAVLGLLCLGDAFPFAIRLDLRGLGLGAAASVPMLAFALYGTSESGLRFEPLQRIHDLIVRVLGAPLRDLRPWQLVFLGMVVGVSEETLFRGSLQSIALEHFQPAAAVVVVSVGFALLHAMTPTYFLLTFAMSLYLGWLAIATANLLVPILVHGLYDSLAFLLFQRQLRRQPQPEPVSPGAN